MNTVPTETGRPSAGAENAPAAWEARRFAAEMPEPCPTYYWRLEALCNAIKWAVVQQRLTPANAAVLDLSAGNGALGGALGHLVAAGKLPALAYHATEQSQRQAQHLIVAAHAAAVAVWTFDPSSSHTITLEEALETAPDTFLRAYPVVVLSHVLEHVADYYGLLDEVWPFVAAGGFLLVVVPRGDEHKSHYTTWEWNRLLAVLRQYAGYAYPVACWEYGPYADLVAAIGKPPERVDGSEVAAEDAPPEGGVQVVANVDHRTQRQEPLNWPALGGKASLAALPRVDSQEARPLALNGKDHR